MLREQLTIRLVKEVCGGLNVGDEMAFLDAPERLADIHLPCEMSCMGFVYCIQGSIRYTVDTISHTMQRGDVLLMPIGPTLNGVTADADFKGKALLLSRGFLNEIIRGMRQLTSLFLFSRTHPQFSLNEEEAQELLIYLGLLERRLHQPHNPYCKDIVGSIITVIIYSVSEAISRVKELSSGQQTRAEKIFTDFIRLVEEHFKKERHVAWYAEKLGITQNYLSGTIKGVSMRTPGQWIDRYVILEICVQLKDTGKSIKEITRELNFCSQSGMGKFFKDHIGVSPSEYRK